MENLKKAANLLRSVESTMDTISVVGIDNQDKFVGCATAVRRVTDMIEKFIQDSENTEPAQAENKEEGVTDG